VARRSGIFTVLLLSLPVCAQELAPLATALREQLLDPEQCYRARDLNFVREDLRVYLTDGWIIFRKPIAGRVISAVFTAESEGGEAEILVMPPTRSERRSLAAFTGTPTFSEKFRNAVLLFSDDSAEEFRRMLEARPGGAQRSAEMGLLLEQRWNPVLRNLGESFTPRLLSDLMNPRAGAGFFFGTASGLTRGNFDFLHDPTALPQVLLGQLVTGAEGSIFDVWTHFISRSVRQGKAPAGRPRLAVSSYRIDAALNEELHLTAEAVIQGVVEQGPLRALLFDLSPHLRVSEVQIGGRPAEFFQRESLRTKLMRFDENDVFLVAAPETLAAGSKVEVRVRFEGDVIRDAGNRVYYVGARSSWYPQMGLHFARYDVTFRYPKRLQLVGPGDLAEEREEGEARVSRWTTPQPIRVFGFNLGEYEKSTVTRGGLRLNLYANKELENALRPPPVLIPPAVAMPRSPRRPPEVILSAPPAPSPAARIEAMSVELAEIWQWMAARFGPPPLKTLTVSPVPGRFGQGFPGLVYLSTLSYLPQPAASRNSLEQTFFTDLLAAHEIAHQWWGNVVTPRAYEDEWLIEGLANYSALMYLEKKKGARAMEAILDGYRRRLLETTGEDRQTLDSAGPVIWGPRLRSSRMKDAWVSIVYEKGSWILHMLRRRLGDAAFEKFLGELARRYKGQAFSTEDFRALAAEFVAKGSRDAKLSHFFEAWVYSTGIPALKLASQVRGTGATMRVTGTVTQSGVEEDFSADVPVEITLPRGKVITEWVRTSSEPVEFTVRVPVAPVKVTLDGTRSVLRRP
jgi:hypothetical protein